ncbi:hypothetical protein D7X88_01635 [bacterium C-53]|nr:hypothetical protein [Lachnospiraceae bacterium]NBI01722.1 hypothetical protein [Lachnospiraceae bacterium]RKJ13008.1 hypothetical protein D7X88_01635 [bacterium C-53]
MQVTDLERIKENLTKNKTDAVKIQRYMERCIEEEEKVRQELNQAVSSENTSIHDLELLKQKLLDWNYERNECLIGLHAIYRKLESDMNQIKEDIHKKENNNELLGLLSFRNVSPDHLRVMEEKSIWDFRYTLNELRRFSEEIKSYFMEDTEEDTDHDHGQKVKTYRKYKRG